MATLLGKTPQRAQGNLGIMNYQPQEKPVVAAMTDILNKMILSSLSQPSCGIIGESESIRQTLRLISQVAPSDCTVLILGETGTGKELVAKEIHSRSVHSKMPMIKVNCAALPRELIESELFGHERGSFTGASERRIGKFEQAHNGTLFLDEIGEMPLDLQVKLLRVLQEREIERVGGRETIKVNVRIIAATNCNILQDVADGKFRSDLYYRLSTFPVKLQPLRERKQDILLLAAHFIGKFASKNGKIVNALSSRAQQEMMNYHWPGNIRELENVMERSVLLAMGTTIEQTYLMCSPAETFSGTTFCSGHSDEDRLMRTLDDNEKDHIINVLIYCKGLISGEFGAAKILNVPNSTLSSKMKRLGICKKLFC